MIALTFDTDWAPAWAIEQIVRYLAPRKVKATFFITDENAALPLLRQYPDLFELGIHPNLQPDSSQGSSWQEVLDHCRKIVPDAVSMRTHGLYQSSNFLMQVHQQFGIRNDVSLFLPNLEVLKPFTFQVATCRLRRIPYNWEDDIAFYISGFDWRLHREDLEQDRIFNFHPIHVALNSPSPEVYAKLRAGHASIAACTESDVREFRHPGTGADNFFREIADRLAETGDSRTIRELCEAAE